MFLFTLAGFAVLAVTMADLALTTLTTRGAGPVTSRATEVLWRGLLALHRRHPCHRLLASSGMLMVAVIAMIWVTCLWAGWSLVFLGAGSPLIDASSKVPADVAERIYFAGYTLFTLGLGDFRPDDDLWRFLTVFCAGNGLLAVTLAVTYLVPIVSAATEKRRLAILVGTLGGSPAEILLNSWDGERFALGGPIDDLVPMIIQQGQQHLAYPALHYFHSPEPMSALSLRLAALGEAALLLRERVPAAHRPSDLTMRRCSLAIASFLQALDHMHIEPAPSAPEAPDIGPLRRAGLPVEETPLVREDALPLHDERERLLAFVEGDGWTWEDIARDGRQDG